jgi:hypothetical protein
MAAMSSRPTLVVHAHFYQPLRADPWTGRVPPDASAAPARDWTARVTAECYRPISERTTLQHASWNLGPTLTEYLSQEAPGVLAGFRAADELGGGEHGGPGIAQSFHHSILPLASLHDRRTEIRWGLRDFEYRFGRAARAMWLPETAMDCATMGLLVDEGVQATILAPWQADTEHLDPRHPYRVETANGYITVAFYDADLSGAVSFEPAVTADADRFARERVAPRLQMRPDDETAPMLLIASDGELYGHHQAFRDLFLDRLVSPPPDAADRGFDVVPLAAVTGGSEGAPYPEMRLRERTSWSCHHGVLRWSGECPCAHDGRWKAPLRAAFERLAGGIDAVTGDLAGRIPGLADVWEARDRYVDVVIGATTADAFVAAELGARARAADGQRLLDILEAQRWRLAMFSSCGWFWDDPWRPETRQVMRCAARAARLIDDLAGTSFEHRLLDDLGTFVSPALGVDGATIYRHALSEVGQPPPRAQA